MGNQIDTRSQFDGGYLYVKTDKPFYYPGNPVYGKIYIRVERAIDADRMEIKVNGKEKASFWYTTSDGKTSSRHKAKTSQKYFDFKATCCQFTQTLQPGDYIIPFEF